VERHEQHLLWTQALDNYQAASLTAQHGWHNVSVACSYYAVFTAMWAALGDPPRRYWEHRDIVDHFAFGQWQTLPAPLERDVVRAIRNLYTARLSAHYQAITLTAVVSTASLATARRVLRLVADAAGLPPERLL
jgi:HEPN domain-containing protein